MPGCDLDPIKNESGEAMNELDFRAAQFHSMLRACRGSLVIVSPTAANRSTKVNPAYNGRVDANIGAGLGGGRGGLIL
jgi:hypothetical protein